MRDLGHDTIDLVKMDIEGAEYQVLEDIINSKIFPTQILVEFHHRFPEIGLQKTKDAINLLKKSGYCIFSISPMKDVFGFIKKDWNQ